MLGGMGRWWVKGGGPSVSGRVRWLIGHRVGRPAGPGAQGQLSSQHMSQSAEMRPK